MGTDPTADSFFSQTMNTPTMMASATDLTPPPTDSAPTTIKMEDLQVPFSTPSPAPSSFSSSNPASTPAPSSSDSKAVKKRKSWGQVLPEPKTSLPPRKRAKTEDEKEQRRIERVKRNRLAAHNSRERKRQETEHLQTEKDQLELELRTLREKAAKMARMEVELKFWRDKYPNDAPESSFDLSPAFPETTDTICPARTSVSFPSPVSIDSMESPRDSSCQPETPASTFEATPDFDLTQYPAVSVGFGHGLPLSGGDPCLSYSLQPLHSVDEKPVHLDNLFDFDQFPEGPTSVEPTGLADSVDFFNSAFFGPNSASNPYGFPDGFDAKFSDLQSASGATYVSDEALAVDH